MRIRFVFTFLILVLNSLPCNAISGELPDKTLSPYFQLISDDPSVDKMPLLSTKVDVSIAGVIADVRVTQTYKNDGANALEAIYVFPSSTRAAVYGMTMTIGERVLVAQIQEKQKAKQVYEQAKQEGKTASLLMQQRPNVFQMNVANIMPGDKIKVELSYTELLTPSEKIYEFVYPTVVTPRYANQKVVAPEGDWIESPYLKKGETINSSFDIEINLSTGIPIQHLESPSHKTTLEYLSSIEASAKLDPSESSAGNRDYILRYQLAGGKIESGLLLYEGKEENFFLLIIQPPERVPPNWIPPRDYVFIVDVSGSMNGFPLDVSKKLLRELISSIRPSDTFNVILFAGVSALLSETPLPANEENLKIAINFIDKQEGSGGTELLPALEKALALPRPEGLSRSIVIVTDGVISVEKEAFDIIRNNLNKSNVFPFGIGSSVNRYIIEGIATVGYGEPLVISHVSEAKEKAELFQNIYRHLY